MISAHAASIGHNAHLGLLAVVTDKGRHFIDYIAVIFLIAAVAFRRRHPEVVPGFGIQAFHAVQLDYTCLDIGADGLDHTHAFVIEVAT